MLNSEFMPWSVFSFFLFSFQTLKWVLWILTQLIRVLEQYKKIAHLRFCFESQIKTSVKIHGCLFFF